MVEVGKAEVRITADITDLRSKLSEAEKQAASIKDPTIKPKVDPGFMGGLSSTFTSEKGKFGAAGKEAGLAFTRGLENQMGPMGGVVTSVASALGPVGLAATAGAVGVLALGAASTKAAADWQSMGTSISRTTGIQGKDLEDLMNGLQRTRMEMGMSSEAAASMAEAAGSIGVGADAGLGPANQQILDFVKATQMASGAWGESAAFTSESIGQMGSVVLNAWNMQRKAAGDMGMSWSEFALRAGGSVDALANAMGSDEKKIVTAMTHASGAIASLAPSEESYGKFTALSSLLIEMGAGGDTAGEQIKDMLNYMARDSEGVLSTLLGTDTAGLNEKLKADAIGTVQEVAKAISVLPAEQRPDIYQKLGQTGSEGMKKIVADVETGVNRLDYAIEIGVKGFKQSELQSSWDAVLKDANTQAARLGEVFSTAMQKIGTAMLPVVSQLLSGAANAGQAAIEKGSELWGKGTAALERVDKAAKEGKGLGGMVTAFLGWGDTAKEEVKDGVKDGAAKGVEDSKDEMKKLGDAATKGLADSISKEMQKVRSPERIEQYRLKAYMSSISQGTAAEDEYITKKIVDRWGQTITALHRVTTQGVYTQLRGENGVILRDLGFSYGISDTNTQKAAREIAEPIVLSIPRYLEARKAETESLLQSAIGDGIITTVGESSEKAGLLAQKNFLRHLKKEWPIEFKAVGLDKVAQDLDNALAGIAGTEIHVDVVLDMDAAYGQLMDLQAFASAMDLRAGMTSGATEALAGIPPTYINQEQLDAIWKMRGMGVADPQAFLRSQIAMPYASGIRELAQMGLAPSPTGVGISGLEEITARQQRLYQMQTMVMEDYLNHRQSYSAQDSTIIDQMISIRARENEGIQVSVAEYLALADAIEGVGAAQRELNSAQSNMNTALATSKQMLAATAESARDCEECVTSLFYSMQEGEWADKGFYQSFIGTTEEYKAWMDAGEAARRAGKGVQMGAAKEDSMKSVWSVDTSQAQSEIQAVKATAEEPVVAQVDADTSGFAAGVAAARASVDTSPIVIPVITVAMGSGSIPITAGAGGGSAPGWVEALEGIPAFAEGGYVSKPTIARIGEVPEIVTPLDKIDQLGARYVSIGSTIINYSGGGATADLRELDKLLEARNRQLEQKILDSLEGNTWHS